MSYGILLQDQAVLQERRWSYLILDESQKIKNPTTKTYQAALALSSSHRLCLTGTPVENSVMDLWSQFNFLNPGMLGSQSEFENRFVKNGNEESHSRELLRKIIYPFLLRRKKEDVLRELPERMEIAQLVEMTDKQQQIYEQWLSSYRSQIFDQVEKEGISKSRLKILEALTFLRQIACHPAILDDSVDLEESGKFQLLEEMLEDILQEGHKVLIFSQFVRFLALIRKLMDKRDWKYEYMDGSTRKREKHIRNFQEQSEIKAFLISLKAGGLGLNLTAADYVIHLDPWWNPAVEQQATDRAHRIGQENPVFVYKYIMKNSVEEKILHLQEKKKELSDQLIVSEKGIIKKLTAEDLQVIFQPASDE
jgi:non-specific serine/threonine protein kinase